MNTALRYASVTLLLCFFIAPCYSQDTTRMNLPDFGLRRCHFGFSLSYNSASFRVDNDHPITGDSLLWVDPARGSGIGLGLVAAVRIHRMFSLRFTPGLSFQNRAMGYEYVASDQTRRKTMVWYTSTWLQLPVAVKFCPGRIGNFAPYALSGFTYNMDMYDRDRSTSYIESSSSLHMVKKDMTIDAGLGANIFFPKFMMGIEARACMGLPEITLPSEDPFSGAVPGIRTRTFILALTFEG